MSLDGAFLYQIKKELMAEGLVGGRVDKIHQPSREEIVITFRRLSGGNGAARLLLSANPSCARVCLTRNETDNPTSPPMFCMLLRKHLSGGRLLDIRQDGLERVIYFDFQCTNEIGDIVEETLCAELTGRCSNLILTEKGSDGEPDRIIDSIKRVGSDVSSVRMILPGLFYSPPPREDRLDIRCSDPEEGVKRLLSTPEQRLEKAMLKAYEGISPVVAREAAFYTARDCEALCSVLFDKARVQRFIFFIKKISDILNGNTQPRYTIICDMEGKYKDFTFFSPEQYGTSNLIRPADGGSLLLDSFFSEKVNAERMKQRSGDLLKTILSAYQRTARKLELQKSELGDTKQRDKYRQKGDLLSANIYKMEKGMKEITVENYETGEMETIPLDPRLSPSANAQKYYGEYKKLDTAEKMLTKLIKQGEEELSYLDSVFDAAGRAATQTELLEIKQELYQTGYLRKGRNQKTDRSPKPLPPLRFRSDDGFEIQVGRNNLQNDKLTLKTAGADDLWLHVKDMAGAHVIIFSGGKSVPDNTIEQAASIAASCSKGASGTKIPVDYTKVRFVKKPSGAKPGKVIFTGNKTILANPDPNLMERLKVK